MIIYISGGVRSGKSRYAQDLALELTASPIYVATAHIWDDDFAKRVERHRQDRGPEWTLLEQATSIHTLPLQGRVAVIDCVTLWLTNLLCAHQDDIENTLDVFRTEIDLLAALDATLIIISNEIGMGVHPETELGRKFADLQGWANQYVASLANHAIFMVSGLPLKLK